MAITFNRQTEVSVPQEGWTFATIKKLALGNPVNTVVGTSDTLFITFLTDDSQLVRHSFLMAAGVSHLLEKLVAVTLGIGEEEVDLEQLNGHRCGIEIAHRSGQNGRLFVNVVGVCSTNELVDEDFEERLPTEQEEELSTFGDWS